MHTTITLDDDVAAAVDAVRRRDGIGPSEAVNQLIRQALVSQPASRPYVHRSVPMKARVDVSNIGAVLDLQDED